MISTEELRDKVATLGSNYLTDKEWIEVIDRLEVADDVVEQAVNRFLSWKLPKDFRPDGGVVFIPTKGRGYDSPHWPCGTNLLNAQQAREMLRYVFAAAPEAKP